MQKRMLVTMILAVAAAQPVSAQFPGTELYATGGDVFVQILGWGVGSSSGLTDANQFDLYTVDESLTPLVRVANIGRGRTIFEDYLGHRAPGEPIRFGFYSQVADLWTYTFTATERQYAFALIDDASGVSGFLSFRVKRACPAEPTACAVTPEPATMLLMITGLLGLGGMMWRRRVA